MSSPYLIRKPKNLLWKALGKTDWFTNFRFPDLEIRDTKQSKAYKLLKQARVEASINNTRERNLLQYIEELHPLSSEWTLSNALAAILLFRFLKID
jgi:hypothetical protein